MINVAFFVALILFSVGAVSASGEGKSGTPKDDAYAAKLWQYMLSKQLIGEGRVHSYPFVGSRPHGSIQEIIATTGTVDGHTGKLIVKHNYGADTALSPKDVYSNNQAENYVALTVMFQREQGYDSANSEWF